MSLKSIVISIFLTVLMVFFSFMPQIAEAHELERLNSQNNPAPASLSALDLEKSSALSVLAEISDPVTEPGTGGSGSLERIITEDPSTTGWTTKLNAPRQTSSSLDVDDLIAACDDLTDTDSDGLPDSVELVLGSDPGFSDSDFDELDDDYEVRNGLDPMKPDSNDDGLTDYSEVTDVRLDIDADGIANAWDPDNDGDSVPDNLDLSPFTRTDDNEYYNFNITTTGNPVYLDFQIRPENSEHLSLYLQSWDWPDWDRQGLMQDHDYSQEDLKVVPMLEIKAINGQLPQQSDVTDYAVIISGDKAYVPLTPTWDYGTLTAFQGRMFYPALSSPESFSLQVGFVWVVKGATDTNQRIINKKSGLYLDVKNASTSPDANVIQNEDTSFHSRRWKLEPCGSDYRIINDNSGFYLDVAGASTNTGACAVQDEDEFEISDNQLWSLEWCGSGCQYRIKNKNSNLYLDVKDNSMSSGAIIVQDSEEDVFSQIWSLSGYLSSSSKDNISFIYNEESDKNLDISDPTSGPGAQVIQKTRDSGSTQKWRIRKWGDYCYIVNSKTGLCLDVKNAGTSADEPVIQGNLPCPARLLWKLEESGGYYRITNKNSLCYLDVRDASTSSGEKIVQDEYEGGDNQLWSLVDKSGGYYRIKNKKSSLFLDVVQGGAGDDVTQENEDTDTGDVSQLWTLVDYNGFYLVVNSQSGLCLDVKYASKTPDTHIIQGYPPSSESRLWSLEQDGSYYRIVNKKSGWYLDVADASTASGATVVQDEDEGSADNQRWQKVDYAWEPGCFLFINKKSGLYLDVENGGIEAGDKIIQHTGDIYDSSQVWMPVEYDDKYFFIVNKNSGLCLDVLNGSRLIDTMAVQNEYQFPWNQVWKLEEDGDCYRVINEKSCYYLDTADNSTERDSVIVQDQQEDLDNQLWKLDQAGECWLITNVRSGLYLDVLNASALPDVSVIQTANDPPDSQLWKLWRMEDTEYYRVMNKNSGYFLDVQNASTQADIAVVQDECENQAHQRWQFEKSGDYYKIKNSNSGLYLDVENSSEDAGAGILMKATGGSDSQKWKIEEPFEDGYYRITNKKSGKVLDVLEYGDESISRAEQDTLKEHEENQLWKLDTGSANCCIINKKSGLFLDTLYISTTQETIVIQASPDNYNNQLWKLVKKDDCYRLVNKSSGYYLDVASASTAAGALIVQDEYEGGDNQLWQLDPGPGASVTLVIYRENFSLTGFSLEENRGSAAGLFYSNDKDQTLRAYITLQYEFLNSQNPLSSAPSALTDNDVTVTSQIESFSHYDEALAEISTVMTPDALDSLDENQVLPIIFAVENSSAGKALDEFRAADNQLWSLVQEGDYYRIINKNSSYYLDVKDASTSPGVSILQDEYESGDNQLWSLEQDGDYYRIINKKSGYYLDVKDASTSPGVNIIQDNYKDLDNQLWRLEQYGEYYLVINKKSGLYMDVANASTSMDVHIIQNELIGPGTEYTIDLGDETEITTRDLQMSWYDTGSDSLLDLDDTLQQVENWGIADDEEKSDMQMLLLYWQSGETRIIRMDQDLVDFASLYPEKNDSLAWVKLGKPACSLVKTVYNFGKNLYNWFSNSDFYLQGKSRLVKLTGMTAGGGKLSQANLLNKQIALKSAKIVADSRLAAADKPVLKAKVQGVLTKTQKATRVLSKIVPVATLVSAVYTFFSLASQSGWSDVGIFAASLYAAMELGYSILITQLFSSTIKGTSVLGALIALSDLIVYLICGKCWTTLLIEKIINWLTAFQERNTVDLKTVNNWVEIRDKDDNGTDAGDDIYIWSSIVERVDLVHNGNSSDLSDSYINGQYENGLTENISTETGSNWKETRKDIGYKDTNVQPGINRPVWARLMAEYKIYYDQWIVGVHSVKEAKGSYEGNPLTVYIDVMPGSLDDLLNWGVIRPQDDGDGLPDILEKGNQTQTFYEIAARHSGKALSVSDSSLAEDARIIQYSYQSGENQQWDLEPVGGDWFRIAARHSGMCIEVPGNSQEDGVNVLQHSSRSIPDNQLWKLERNGDYYRIINKKSGLYLDVEGNSTGMDRAIVQDIYEELDNQLWRLEQDGEYYRIVNKKSQYFLDVANASTAAGAKIVQDEHEGGDNQLWRLEKFGSYYFVINLNSGFYVDVKDASTGSQAYIIQNAYLFPDNQLWKLIPVENGYYKMVARHSDKCLGVKNSDANDGAFIVQEGYNGSDSQKWTLQCVESRTFPELADSDNDELPDNFEVDYVASFNTSPVNDDSDSDGLKDGVELHFLTSASNPDSDCDDLDDCAEYNGWTVQFRYFNGDYFSEDVWPDPNNPDSDSDGLTDYQESLLGTSPVSADTDGDGLDDATDPRPLTSGKSLTVSGITASDKTYDGDTAATLDTSGAALEGVIDGDDVSLNKNSAAGNFADKNAGTDKKV
ncbi:MAG: RICIN domain-containing protein, partial [Dehalococcoidales bacterium]|nr:RICIN domain-containing protein [Dehalococcoidales bacterium]